MDISHPGHLPLLCSRLYLHFHLRDYGVSQTKRQVNAFIYVWTMLPTQSPFCTDYPYSTWRELPFWAFIVRGKDSWLINTMNKKKLKYCNLFLLFHLFPSFLLNFRKIEREKRCSIKLSFHEFTLKSWQIDLWFLLF